VENIEFISELRGLKVHMLSRWLICGDFNLIKKASEKINFNLNLRMMGRFRAALDEL
jgi:hypothetical protein